MFKPPKPPSNQPARQRLPLVDRAPKQDDVAGLFTGALRIRGTLFELPIKPSQTSKTYLVTCEFDASANNTIWAMYEGEDGSTALWNTPQNDLDLIFDMICMSCQPSSVTLMPPEVSARGQLGDSIAPAYAPPVTSSYSDFANTTRTTAEPSPKPSGQGDITNFIDFLDKGKPNLLLGHLFVEAGMVPDRCLDSALKLQEMVREGRLTDAEAILALKKTAASGCMLNDSIIQWAKNPDAIFSSPSAAESTYSSQFTASDQSASMNKRDDAIMAKTIDLLKQSGLITQNDADTAQKVKSKHGGDLGQILVSAGKVSGKTLEATIQCQEYIQHQRLRIDQAIMALHYCERMRTTLEEALSELSMELI